MSTSHDVMSYVIVSCDPCCGVESCRVVLSLEMVGMVPEWLRMCALLVGVMTAMTPSWVYVACGVVVPHSILGNTPHPDGQY